MVMKLERMLNVLMLITSSGGSLHKTSSQKSYYHSLHTSIKRYNELGKFSFYSQPFKKGKQKTMTFVLA